VTLRQAHHELSVATRSRGLFDVTAALRGFLQAEHARDGLLTVFIRHTSASLVVQENASSEVRVDLERFFAELVPAGDPRFTHTDEGPDDMPSHVRAALTQTQLSIPVRGGVMQLGTWQAVYVFEHRTSPHRRSLALHYLGD
jgi:secondary thiamine-phosphate synthase enzyme